MKKELEAMKANQVQLQENQEQLAKFLVARSDAAEENLKVLAEQNGNIYNIMSDNAVLTRTEAVMTMNAIKTVMENGGLNAHATQELISQVAKFQRFLKKATGMDSSDEEEEAEGALVVAISETEYAQLRQWLEDNITSKEEAKMKEEHKSFLKADHMEPLNDKHIGMSKLIYDRMVKSSNSDNMLGWYTWGGLVEFLESRHIWGPVAPNEFWDTLTKTKNRTKYHFSYQILIMEGDLVMVKVRPFHWQDSMKTNDMVNKKRNAARQSSGSEGSAVDMKPDKRIRWGNAVNAEDGTPFEAEEKKKVGAEEIPGRYRPPPPPAGMVHSPFFPNQQGNNQQPWVHYGAAWGPSLTQAEQAAAAQQAAANAQHIVANAQEGWNQQAWYEGWNK